MTFSKDQLLTVIADIAPNPYLQALMVIVLFFILAKIFDLILVRFVRRWVARTHFTLDDSIFDILHRPVFVSIMLVGLGLAAEQLQLPDKVDFMTFGGLKTVAIFLWSMAAARFFKLLLGFVSQDQGRFIFVQERTLPLLNNLLVILVTALAVYFVFLAWKIDVTAWMASAGILGLAISFAAKDTLANLFSGVFIVADAPYKLGDFIVLDSGERGEVTHIGIRSTRLLTRDDVEVTVPNSVMGNAKIINESGGPHEKYRLRVKVGVAYGSDIDKVHAVLLDVASNHPDVAREPAPRVRFRGFGDSSLDHELLCWVERPVKRGLVLHLLNTAIYKRFMAEDIEIPFPQRDVHLYPAQGTETR
ncbi:MAG TPA: mechanosensitive ion channel [Desulfobacteraceae bacterium]|nr:mechanosensitive ion channel [Deltaproteobacteria bacterium]HDI59490.1 mechanosensitive ion channel [Desulfobacteraceae bacterium]